MTINDVKVEITFDEWASISATDMGLLSCQECHMPLDNRPAADGGPDRIVHQHTFRGVDLNLSEAVENTDQFTFATELLESAVTLELNPPSSVESGDSLEIPITVTSLTAHSLPSGVSFSREAWLEIVITDRYNTTDTLYQSGVVPTDSTSLDIYNDLDLLLFTSYLIDDDGKTTQLVMKVNNIINKSLMAGTTIMKIYKVKQNRIKLVLLTMLP